MYRIVKFLKPYLALILISVALLFVQANADLALPDYMSRIVNKGIQQGGVENAIPIAIRQSEMDKLVLFMSEEDQKLVLNDYILVDQARPVTPQLFRIIRFLPPSQFMSSRVSIKPI